MEKSETQKEVIELGKLLVKQLNLDSSVDTLGRWMAHYIAEKITEAEHATDGSKASAQAECFQLILELWEHRWDVQREYRPLKNFDRLLELLRKIDPDNHDPYYYRLAQEKTKAESDSWINAAYDIDKAARVCLKYTITRAANAAESSETEPLLAAASVLGPDPDIMVIQELMNNKDYDLDPEDLKLGDDFNRDFDKGSIENHIKYLDILVKHAEEIKANLKKQLKFGD